MINDKYILNKFINKRNQINSKRLKNIDEDEFNYLINKTNKNDLYQRKILCWTIYDPLKRKIAKENNLNYLEAWTLEELKNKLQLYLK